MSYEVAYHIGFPAFHRVGRFRGISYNIAVRVFIKRQLIKFVQFGACCRSEDKQASGERQAQEIGRCCNRPEKSVFTSRC